MQETICFAISHLDPESYPLRGSASRQLGLTNTSRRFKAVHSYSSTQNVFDRDKLRSNAKNYTFSMSKDGERIVAYGLYTYVSDAQYCIFTILWYIPIIRGKVSGNGLCVLCRNYM